ncbi:MAG: hypothetical protein KBC73_08515 [Burkholderiaceae bacterium]|nr:hypothetical protein [Burkholderiaceae bacterium]
MPGSFPVFDAVVEHLLQRLAPPRALDIGAGAGKYGRMLAAAVPAGQRVAVEIEPAYVQRFGLDQCYQRVDLADAAQWWRQHPDECFDLAVLGDSLEHLPKSAGIDLLNALVYRCAWIVVVAPEFIVQQAVDGVASEAHQSVWSERDLHWHDLWAWDNCRAMTLLVLRGYQASPNLTLAQWVAEVNAGQIPLRHFDGQADVRPARLRLVQQPREVDYRLP